MVVRIQCSVRHSQPFKFNGSQPLPQSGGDGRFVLCVRSLSRRRINKKYFLLKALGQTSQ